MLRPSGDSERVALDLAVGRARNCGHVADLLGLGPRSDSFFGDAADSLVELRAVAHHQRDDALAPLDVLDARDRDVAHAVERGERGFELFGPEFSRRRY